MVVLDARSNMQIAQNLGADVMQRSVRRLSCRAQKSERTELSFQAHGPKGALRYTRPDQALFGIVQGGMHLVAQALRLSTLSHW